jgi:hypothetical protein
MAGKPTSNASADFIDPIDRKKIFLSLAFKNSG